MTEISQSQLRREAVEITLWQMPSHKPDAATMSELSQFDSESAELAVGNIAVEDGSSLPDLGPLSKFSTWESVAATLMRKAASLSGFNPESTAFDPVAWNNYIYKFSAMPAFSGYRNDTRSTFISPLSLGKVVDAVEDLAQSFMTPENFNAVMETIKKIGQLALENQGEAEKQSFQQVGLLSRNRGNLYLGVVRTEVTMMYKAGKGYEQLQQDLSICCRYGVLDFDNCIRNASTLLQWDPVDMTEWEGGTASASYSPNQCPAWNQ
ncbi:hypothetical protein ACIBJI_10805 [Nocardia sp. NPDC050408]|uniref:hypothetical protein n=1 Tax=unclassified Nocardia TaxID=2637762 RepID=UPI0034344AFB